MGWPAHAIRLGAVNDPDRRLIWKDANLDGGGTLTVPLDPPADADWVAAFQRTLRERQNEVRGQHYKQVRIEDDGLHANGVPAQSAEATANFLDALVAESNWQFSRTNAEHERALADARQRSERAAADAERATRALRERE